MVNTQASTPEPYRGRFAPSPTGPLHFGSLVSALGSYLQARTQGGSWLVRMEDLDPPREMAGAAADILRTLEAYGLHWDGKVLYQSQRQAAYAEAVDQLTELQLTFPCACSRKSIAAIIKRSGEMIYPGTCREGLAQGSEPRAIRMRVPQHEVRFDDALQGSRVTALHRDVGDFVIHRADGLYAYHLAVVVDDAFQAITEIVRGADLLEATPPQLYLQEMLGLPRPAYAHLPIAVNAQGEKLSKQTYASSLDTRHPGPTLARALTFLGHPPDVQINPDDPAELLAWAVKHWRLEQVPHRFSLPAGETGSE